MYTFSLPLSTDEVATYPFKTIFPHSCTPDDGFISKKCLPSKAPFYVSSDAVKPPTFLLPDSNSIIIQTSDDLWSHVLSFLTIPEIFNNFKSTCFYFNRLVMRCIVTLQISSRSIQLINLSDFLNLQVLWITHMNPPAFKGLENSLRKCINLRKLVIEFSSIKKRGSAIITSELEHLENFLELRVDCCNLSRASLSRFINFLHKVPSLQGISFTDNGLLPDCAKLLMEALPLCKNLRLIDLDSNKLGDEGICEIASKLALCNLIESFSASSNEIGNRGCTCLFKQLPMLKNLHYLDLSDNNIDQHSITDINPNLFMSPHLQYLDISGNLFVKGTHIFPDFDNIYYGSERKLIGNVAIKIHQTPRVLRLSSCSPCLSSSHSKSYSKKEIPYISDDETHDNLGNQPRTNYNINDNNHLSSFAIEKELRNNGHLDQVDKINEHPINYELLQADIYENHTLPKKKTSKIYALNKRSYQSKILNKTPQKRFISNKRNRGFWDDAITEEETSDEEYTEYSEPFDRRIKRIKNSTPSPFHKYPCNVTGELSNPDYSRHKPKYSETSLLGVKNRVISLGRVPQTRAQAFSENDIDFIALNSELSQSEDEFEDKNTESEDYSEDKSEHESEEESNFESENESNGESEYENKCECEDEGKGESEDESKGGNEYEIKSESEDESKESNNDSIKDLDTINNGYHTDENIHGMESDDSSFEDYSYKGISKESDKKGNEEV